MNRRRRSLIWLLVTAFLLLLVRATLVQSYPRTYSYIVSAPQQPSFPHKP